jgi:Leucine-rich repeat (LRR) protein
MPAQFPTEPQIVTFPDKNLETTIKNALGKPLGEEMLSTELARLTKLSIQNRNVSDLTGLEYCTNLTFLEVRGEPVVDISPLSSLSNLTYLHLNNT